MSDGVGYLTATMALAALIGFSFTAGMWAFCWAFNWSPVNITNNTTIYEGEHLREAETRSAA